MRLTSLKNLFPLFLVISIVPTCVFTDKYLLVELEQVENQEPGSNEEPEDTEFFPDSEYEEGCAARTRSTVCPNLKNRTACLTSIESRWESNVPGGEIHGAPCGWCSKGPCNSEYYYSSNSDHRCQPKTWLVAKEITGIETCMKTDCDRNCSHLPDPVCGSDTKTHPNKCMFGVAKCKNPSLTVEHKGRCKELNEDCQENDDCKEGAICVRGSCIGDEHANITPNIKTPMEKYYRKQDYGGGYRTLRKSHPKRGYRQWDTTTTSTTTTPPPPVDCEMGEWEEWSKFKCSNREDNCGYCKRKRNKQVVKECENGGDCSCKEEQGIDRKRRPCPVDCEMGGWTRWTKCYCPGGKKCVPHDSTETCKKRRKRPVAKQGANGGKNDCEREYDNKDCTTKCAPPTKPGWPTTTTRWPGGGHRRMLATPPPQYKK